MEKRYEFKDIQIRLALGISIHKSLTPRIKNLYQIETTKEIQPHLTSSQTGARHRVYQLITG